MLQQTVLLSLFLLLRAHQGQEFNYLPFVVSIGILVKFFHGAIDCFCVWNRKRKQSQSIAKESLTIYEYVKNAQVSRDQRGHFRASGSSSDVRGDERGQRESDRRLFQVIFRYLPSLFSTSFLALSKEEKEKRNRAEKMEMRQKGHHGAVLNLPRGRTQ
nr:natural killer cell receptor 2B4-like isoform X2 [Rattus norvegicus]